MGVNGVRCSGYEQAFGSGQDQSSLGKGVKGAAFSDLLQTKKLESLNFSKHAAKRMDERGINLDGQLMDNLAHAVEGARQKGAKDVAVIGSQGVFIVNVPNNVVITTMSTEDMKDKVFTNIDSAVLM